MGSDRHRDGVAPSPADGPVDAGGVAAGLGGAPGTSPAQTAFAEVRAPEPAAAFDRVQAQGSSSPGSSPRRRLIGRAAELRTVLRAIGDGQRAIVLAGPSGVGKSQLAESVVEALGIADEAAGGNRAIVRCDLRGASNLDDMVTELARALGPGVKAATGPDGLAQVGRRLAAHEDVVVLLDHLDALVGGESGRDVRKAIGGWLDESRATIVITARNPVLRRRAHNLLLAPLPLPPEDRLVARTSGSDPGPGFASQVAADAAIAGDGAMVAPVTPPPPGRARDDADLAHNPAVALLVDGIRAIWPAFLPEGPALVALGRIARCTGGLPAAIELAAAPVVALGPLAAAERLEAHIDGGTTTEVHAGADPAYVALVGFALSLLTDLERIALGRCAVFCGGFTLDAARDVLGIGDSKETAAVIGALRSKALVATKADDGAQRYGVVPALEPFARELLDASGERAAVEARHTEHFLAVGRPFLANWLETDPGGEVILSRERDNLNAVWSRLQQQGDGERALWASAILYTVYARSGPMAAFADMARTSLEMRSARHAAPFVRARVLLQMGHALAPSPESMTLLAQAHEAACAAKDQPVEVVSLARLAAEHGRAGQAKEARRCFGQAEDLVGDHLPPLCRSFLDRTYAQFLVAQGDRAAARPRLLRALDTCRNAHDQREEAMVLLALGGLDLDDGDPESACERLARAYEGFSLHGNARFSANTLAELGLAQFELRQLDRAEGTMLAALDGFVRLGDPLLEGMRRGYLGHLYLEQGRFDDACGSYDRAIAALEDVDERPHRGMLTAARAVAQMALGGESAARHQLARARVLVEGLGMPAVIAAVDLFARVLELEQARRAAERGQEGRARHLWRQAIGTDREDASSAIPVTSIEMRIARRMLESRSRELPKHLSAVDCGGGIRLEVGHGLAWVDVGGRGRIDLSRTPIMRRILVALLEHHERLPAAGLGYDAVFRAGWPGAQISVDSAKNRVHVTLNRMRNLGLRAVLVTAEDGVCLDPSIEVSWAAPERSTIDTPVA